jgi:hypothetical protein
MAFFGVLAVVFAIFDVVEEINGTGYQAKTDECQPAAQEIVGIKNVFGKDERGQNKHIFNPLMRAHCAK